MAFDYACFISYRHGETDFVNSCVDQLHEALQNELEPLVGPQKIYRDTDRLSSGQFIDVSIERALASSACMIIAYMPMYFSDPKHCYCTREYLGMLDLEQQRLSQLPQSEVTNGLIIPVVFRGPGDMPSELKKSRLYEDFSAFSLSERRISRNKKFCERIRGMAQYVAKVHRVLEDHCANANQSNGLFHLPSEETAKTWLENLQRQPQVFPGR